ncbi:hypothetical protein RB195_021120 [Necator americanus]|uniref:C3H1-type domain-containing protein n=2 Tax=Ancylostomatidae TaxID=33278 RepID=A0ABR1E9G4_NECAM
MAKLDLSGFVSQKQRFELSNISLRCLILHANHGLRKDIMDYPEYKTDYPGVVDDGERVVPHSPPRLRSTAGCFFRWWISRPLARFRAYHLSSDGRSIHAIAFPPTPPPASHQSARGFMFDENSNTAAGAGAVVAQSGALAPGTIPGNVSAPNSAIVTQLLNVKDSRWLQVEVCREFQRGQCARSDLECKFAHPPPHVDVQQGRVTACYDSIKGRCTRENPKCKYLHPPQHIKDQLLINGRNNLALKNLISAQLNQTATGQPIAVNPIAQIMQQQQAVAAANMMPTLPYPYYQGLVYSPVLQADPYQAAVSQAGVPCKRPAVDKNGAVVYSANPQPAQQFSPYVLPGLQGYVPAVSFSGPLPPRY